MLRSMVRRRGRTDPLNAVNAPRWLAVRDKLGHIIQVEALEASADLRGALKARTDALAAEGWDIDSIPSCCAFVFCQRENVRVCVSIEAVEPGTGVFDHFANEDWKQT